ncbi:hypothetical protein HYX16_05490 [Candidatus Woesearchaeota archaeon]|nr:hypothetical protein [Candidatus Woesearchaeota archaeon]
MIIAKTKKWGNSIGLIIPKEEAKKMHIGEDQEIGIEVVKKENPLRELFGALKFKKSTEQLIKESRKLLESKWM